MDYGCFAPARVFVDVFQRHGVSITMDQAREPMGVHKKVHIRQISTMEDVATRWEEVHGKRPTEEEVDAMFQEFIPLQTSCLTDYADLIPGTVEAVAEFRKRGLKIGSTTGYGGDDGAVAEDTFTVVVADSKAFVDPAVKLAPVPVIFVPTRADGVPSAGVTKVGEVPKTSRPEPVSSEITPASSAEVVAAKSDNLFVNIANVLVPPGIV